MIKFEEHVKKILNSMWIRPIFTIIPLNSSEFPKIGKFGIIFDAILLEIDDLAVLSRHFSSHSLNSRMNLLIQIPFHTAKVEDMYTSSQDERAITFC